MRFADKFEVKSNKKTGGTHMDKQAMVDRAARILMALPDDKTSFICGFIGKVARKLSARTGVNYDTGEKKEKG